MAPEPPSKDAVPAPAWATDGAAIELDPTSFRNYGRNVAKISNDISTDTVSANMALRGPGPKDMLMSTSFGPGQEMQDSAFGNAEELGMFLLALPTNVSSIASGGLLLGDIFGSMDGDNAAMLNAVQFAFRMPGAKKPAGLPSWIDTKKTVADTLAMRAESTSAVNTAGDKLISTVVVDGTTITTYQTHGGGVRTVLSKGATTTEYAIGKDGKRLYEIKTIKKTEGEGKNKEEVLETITTHYENDARSGQERRVTRTKHLDKNTDDQFTTVEQLDKDGRPRKTDEQRLPDHVVTYRHSDGTHSREYYTETRKQDTTDVNHNGDKKEMIAGRTNERKVGPQADPQLSDDAYRERLNQARHLGGA